MQSVLIFITLITVLFLAACSGYPAIGALPPDPSPTPIAVATLSPTATPLPPAPVAGEGSPPAETVAQPEPTRPPTETPQPEPTATPEPDWLNYAGRTEEGLMFLGNPEAPVTLIDFSDFM